ERIAEDTAFGVTLSQLEDVLQPSAYVGRAPEQTDEFLTEQVNPILKRYHEMLGVEVEITV
ncbi:MAG TPA: adenylosuccinate lyase, partial [Ruminococcaceae bacterium]|nr:adenylosuccinate lyase [Oscillospiraceae bacterium]